MNNPCNAGMSWNDEEDNKLINSYRVLELDVTHISKDSLSDYVKNYDGQLLGVYNKKHEHTGNVSLNSFDYILRSCSFAIMMSGKYKGQGFGLEASSLMLRHAFQNLNIHRVYLGVVEWNKPAIKLYEKLGFKRDGLLRDAFWAKGQFHNLLYYSIFKNEFKYLDE